MNLHDLRMTTKQEKILMAGTEARPTVQTFPVGRPSLAATKI
jgi:hypothetical protein